MHSFYILMKAFHFIKAKHSHRKYVFMCLIYKQCIALPLILESVQSR